jgi:Insecticide toxin TcdB middle/N-terminal region
LLSYLHYALSLGFVSSFCRTSSDTISHGKITTQYSYHHGHWEGTERDYLGFGRVDKRDTEEFNHYNSCTSINSYAEKIPEVFFSSPTETRTWFHQEPVYDGPGSRIESDFTDEYWEEVKQV